MLVDEVANLEPAGLHRMVADWAGLSKNALCLRTCAHRPGFAGFEDTARVAGQAIEIGESPRVGVGETGLRLVMSWTLLSRSSLLKAEVEETRVVEREMMGDKELA